MKNKNITWIGLCLIMALAMSVLWIACQEVPNRDRSATLNLNVNLPGAGAAGSGTGAKILLEPMAASAGYIIPPPPADTNHLRINISNPDESFYVYDYENGVPISLLVSAGTGRVVDVEAYIVPGGTINPAYDYLNANHFLTGTSVALRTLDLSGEAVAVTIDLVWDTNTTSIMKGDTSSFTYLHGGTILPLPGITCPDGNFYYANITDLNFGITFPSIPVTLWDNTLWDWKLTVDNLLQNRNYIIHVWNDEAYIYDNLGVTTGSSLTTGVRALHFLGFNPDPFLVFNPGSISGVSPGDSLRISVQMVGGWGSFNFPNQDALHTCFGSWDSMAQEWFVDSVPPRTVCVIDLSADDCDFNWAEGSMLIYTSLPGMCNGNSVCEPAQGEDNSNCPAPDCYCGDGQCFPPWEDEINCSGDCGA